MKKNVVVIGGSSGIGAILVQDLLQKGCSVVNCDIKLSPITNHPEFVSIPVDLSSNESINDMVEVISKGNGSIDQIFYCAGIAEEPTAELKDDFEFVDKLVAINSSSVIKVLSKLVPMMTYGGSIVITSSAHSIRAANWNPIYSGTKGFLDSFVKSYSKSLIEKSKREGTELIRINAVNPEMVDTPLIHDLFVGREDDLKKVTDTRIMGRLLESKEVVNVMLFLASDAASGMTGNITPIGGNI